MPSCAVYAGQEGVCGHALFCLPCIVQAGADCMSCLRQTANAVIMPHVMQCWLYCLAALLCILR